MKNLGIYIHIPFCKQKCVYCDFISFPCMENKMESYFECVLKEITKKAEELKNKVNDYSCKELEKYEICNDISNKKIDTIYIGGGTPSIVPAEYIEEIISKIFEKYDVSKDVEITIEVNPGTVDEIKLKKYFEIGINRLSIGLQTTKKELLKMLGRIHSYEDFEKTYQIARNVGFNNINVDLMIGLPNQTIEDVEDSLNKIIDKSPEHISVYSLIVEENTKMYDLIEENIIKLPEEELERKMYWKVKEILEKNGYNHYEISNFAKQNYESKHNLNCWNQHEYVGFGVSAHSYLNKIRYSNINNINQYIENCKNGNSKSNIIIHENQTKEQIMKEYMLIGLRKIDGVMISEFKNKFVDNPVDIYRKELNKLVNEDLIEINEDCIKLTNKGLDLANIVWMEFI